MKSLMATGILECKVYGTANIECTPTVLSPVVQAGNQPVKSTNTVSVAAGDSLLLDVVPVDGGGWSWSGPGRFASTTRSTKLKGSTPDQSGTYMITYLNACGAFSYQDYNVTVWSGSALSDPYTRPAYSPNINSSKIVVR